MPITEAELIAGIEAKNGFPLDAAQRQAIQYGAGPLLIAAGPGTGKTEVLVARCLKFICCDGVPPGSIMLTTFTEKAAKNLQDRLSEAFLFLAGMYPQLANIDPSDLRIGTLHGLCNDILQEYRYTAYQNLRLLDEVTSALLLHKSVVSNIQPQQPALFGQFNYLFGNKRQNDLSKWDWALALQQTLNRLVEDQINVNLLQQAGGPWAALLQADAVYEQALANTCACDFSRLLRYFLDFLGTAQGNLFLSGDGTGVRLPLTHVLVDEYQDTNPIQESIYLRLSDTPPHNITVVGDDDQALYRFRGGTVECMVGFPSACQARWGVNPQIIYLSDNHRSDRDIVQWCNAYITSFPQMAAPNVRIPGKPPLNSAVGRTGTHPAVGIIRAGTVGACATGMATLVSDLRTNGIIQDYSQCVLLLRSAKNSPHFAGPYVAALQARNIPIYNPRSKDYLEQPEVAQCLGAFIRIIDAQLTQIGSLMSPSILHGNVDVLVASNVGGGNAVEIWDYKGANKPSVGDPDYQRYVFQMQVYADLYRQKTGNVPSKAILYFLNELAGNPPPMVRPVNALLEVNLNPAAVQQALQSFGQTVQQIEACRAARNWPNPTVPPPEKTCSACDLRWNCAAAAGFGRQYPMRYP